MDLEPGSHLAHYEITGPLGMGGMGVVYRARDTRLGREVAIKVLPSEFLQDSQRVARFDREARLLASLSHPGIAGIYGVEELGGAKFLVMELVTGSTLEARLAQGPIAVDEAIPIARQIAAGLEAAHERGIIHRDLKPANIMLDTEGATRILDFGLGRNSDAEERALDVANSPTMVRAVTHDGIILGTAPYMSPEQARGRRVDKRADIWAFGVVLWEMLTGRRLFAGETISDTLAAVLTREIDSSELPPDTPPHVRLLLDRCLQRDPRKRLRDIGDALLELDSPRVSGITPQLASSTGQRRMSWVLSLLGIVAALIAGLWLGRARPRNAQAVVHTTISLPQGTQLAGWSSPAVAISPDGSVVAFVAAREGKQELYLRRLSDGEARVVEGSGGAEGPFFSPDGKWVAFGAGNISSRDSDPPALKKAPVSGGVAQVICPIKDYFGGTWGTSGIYFVNTERGGIERVSASGGSPQNVSGGEAPANRRTSLHWPQILPGEEALLVSAEDEKGLMRPATIDLKTGRMSLLEPEAVFSRYVEGGRLFYVGRDGTMFVASFSPKSLQIEGSSAPLLSDIAITANDAAVFAVSDEGTAIFAKGYVRGSQRELRRLVDVDLRGVATTLPFDAGTIDFMATSPDGTRIALTTWSGELWIYDLRRQTKLKLPQGLPNKTRPVWSPDSRRIFLTATESNRLSLVEQDAFGAENPRSLLRAAANESYPSSVSPDSRWLLYYTTGGRGASGWQVSAMPLSGGADRQLFEGYDPQFSPDGRWISYQSNHSGLDEVYLRSFPDTRQKVLVSSGGGRGARWAADGRKLFYWRGNDLMAVAVQAGAELTLGNPEVQFSSPNVDMRSSRYVRGFDVLGDRFRMLQSEPDSGVQTNLELVQNWFSEIESGRPRE